MKKVSFSENVEEYQTYSYKEYDRSSIDHVLYRIAYKRLSDNELRNIFTLLNIYKLYEMPVHIKSIQNTNYNKKYNLFI